MQLQDLETLARRAQAMLAAWGAGSGPVRVVWNPRLRTSAGRALPRSGRIELNPHLLGRAGARLDAILAHEAAHLAAYRLHGDAIRPHGREWARLLRAAGHRPDVTHDLPAASRRRRRYLYLRLCERCGARRIRPSVRYDRCGGCGSKDPFLVLRAPAGGAGWQALKAITLSEARHRCIMAGP